MMEYNALNVGQAIRAIRQNKNMTVKQLSAAVGKCPEHISRIENGTRKISIDMLVDLMNALDADANSILAVPMDNLKSIDTELRKLPKVQQDYLSNLFMDMIAHFPAA